MNLTPTFLKVATKLKIHYKETDRETHSLERKEHRIQDYIIMHINKMDVVYYMHRIIPL